MKFPVRRAALVLAIIASAILPNAGAAAIDEQALVVSIAEAQIGKPFRLGLEGPTRFDCSGLVHFVFSQAGLLDRIGGRRFLAEEYYKWGRERGLLAQNNPRVGDLVLWKNAWAKRITHMGIYVGDNAKGKPLAISALTVGVMRHKVNTISVPFFSYIHVGLGMTPDPSPTPTSVPPSPTPTPTPTPTATPTLAATPTPEPAATPTP